MYFATVWEKLRTKDPSGHSYEGPYWGQAFCKPTAIAVPEYATDSTLGLQRAVMWTAVLPARKPQGRL